MWWVVRKLALGALTVALVVLVPIIAVAQATDTELAGAAANRPVPGGANRDVIPADPTEIKDDADRSNPVGGQVRTPEKRSDQTLDEIREDVRNAVIVVLELKQQVDQLRTTSGAPAESIRKITELETRISSLERRLLLNNPVGGTTDTAPTGATNLRGATIPGAAPPGPGSVAGVPKQPPVPESKPPPPVPQRDEASSALRWQITPDTRGVPRLVSKREAEQLPDRMATREQCADVGAWIDERGTALAKPGFFVRDGSIVVVCKRGAEGDWRVYEDSAQTDRFHVVARTRG
jgi:hypothetical protein